MQSKLKKSRRFILLGILIIAVGINFTTILKDSVGSLGTVFIAVGGLFFIIGMNFKREGK